MVFWKLFFDNPSETVLQSTAKNLCVRTTCFLLPNDSVFQILFSKMYCLTLRSFFFFFKSAKILFWRYKVKKDAHFVHFWSKNIFFDLEIKYFCYWAKILLWHWKVKCKAIFVHFWSKIIFFDLEIKNFF